MAAENSDKEVEVAKFMAQAMKKPEDDIQKASISAHHDRNAEQITGHAPFHQSKSLNDNLSSEGRSDPNRRQPSGQNIENSTETAADRLESAKSRLTQTIVKREPVQTEEDAGRTMLPVLTTKTEDPDGLDSTVELVECSPEQKIERVESFPTYSQIETIEIQNDARDENVTIYTTSQVQGTSATGHEITYIDEQDGSHIGQSQRAQTVSVQSNPPPAKRRHLAPSNETQQAVIQNNSGQGRHVIIPNGHQIIQVAGSDGQPAQIMIVPQGNVILIPQMNQNTPQKKQHQPQALQVVQNLTGTPQQQIVLVNSNNDVGQKPVKIIKVSESSPLEYAANIAGIKNGDGKPDGQQVSVVESREVNQQHVYPSPFSQVPVEERPHSCNYCYKRFARADECKRHERIHTDTRPFECQYCPRRFTRKDHLRTHTRCHTKEKPYVCPICERGFARSDERIRHVKTHVKKGEGTLEEIKSKMPKPKFEQKKALPTPTTNLSISTPTLTTQSPKTFEIKLNTDNTIPVSNIGGQETVTKAIPITVIPAGSQMRTAQVRISQ